MSNIVISKLVGGVKKHAPALDSELNIPIDTIDTSDAAKNKAFSNSILRKASNLYPSYYYQNIQTDIPVGGEFITNDFVWTNNGNEAGKIRDVFFQYQLNGYISSGLVGGQNQQLQIYAIINGVRITDDCGGIHFGLANNSCTITSAIGSMFPIFNDGNSNITFSFAIKNMGAAPLNGVFFNFKPFAFDMLKLEVA